jgi:hypothetical protein
MKQNQQDKVGDRNVTAPFSWGITAGRRRVGCNVIAIVISINLLNRQIPLVSGGPTFLSGKI